MEKSSLPDLARRLNDLAEIMDKKPLGEKAILGWFETLREFETGIVFGSLKGWQKTHARFPTPAEVWKACNEFSSELMEKQQVTDKIALARSYAQIKPTDEGRLKLSRILGVLAVPKPTPLQHWEKVLRTPDLPQISYDYAHAFIAKQAKPKVDRQPGQDDEERVA